MFLTEYYEIFRFFIHRHPGAALLDLLCGEVQHLFRLRRKIERVIKPTLTVLHPEILGHILHEIVHHPAPMRCRRQIRLVSRLSEVYRNTFAFLFAD